MSDQSREATGELSDFAAPVVLVTVVLLVFIGLSILWWPTAL
jgi:diacylglycerol kinase